MSTERLRFLEYAYEALLDDLQATAEELERVTAERDKWASFCVTELKEYGKEVARAPEILREEAAAAINRERAALTEAAALRAELERVRGVAERAEERALMVTLEVVDEERAKHGGIVDSLVRCHREAVTRLRTREAAGGGR